MALAPQTRFFTDRVFTSNVRCYKTVAVLKNKLEMLQSALRRTFITTFTKPQTLKFSTTAFRMGVTKEVIAKGDETTYAKSGDDIIMEYTGTLENGKQYVQESALPLRCWSRC